MRSLAACVRRGRWLRRYAAGAALVLLGAGLWRARTSPPLPFPVFFTHDRADPDTLVLHAPFDRDSVCLCGDGRTLVWATDDWPAEHRIQPPPMPMPGPGDSANRTLVFYDTQRRRVIRQLTWAQPLTYLEATRDGRHLILAGGREGPRKQGWLERRRLADGALLRRMVLPPLALSNGLPGVSDDGRIVVGTFGGCRPTSGITYDERRRALCDLGTGSIWWDSWLLPSGLSPDGRLVAMPELERGSFGMALLSTPNGSVARVGLRDTRSGDVVRFIPMRFGRRMGGFTFTENGGALAIRLEGFFGARIGLWSVHTGRPLPCPPAMAADLLDRYPVLRDNPWDPARNSHRRFPIGRYTEDGSLLLYAGPVGQEARARDPITGRVARTWAVPGVRMLLTYSPKSRLLAFEGDDDTLRLKRLP